MITRGLISNNIITRGLGTLLDAISDLLAQGLRVITILKSDRIFRVFKR